MNPTKIPDMSIVFLPFIDFGDFLKTVNAHDAKKITIIDCITFVIKTKSNNTEDVIMPPVIVMSFRAVPDQEKHCAG